MPSASKQIGNMSLKLNRTLKRVAIFFFKNMKCFCSCILEKNSRFLAYGVVQVQFLIPQIFLRWFNNFFLQDSQCNLQKCKYLQLCNANYFLIYNYGQNNVNHVLHLFIEQLTKSIYVLCMYCIGCIIIQKVCIYYLLDKAHLDVRTTKFLAHIILLFL